MKFKPGLLLPLVLLLLYWYFTRPHAAGEVSQPPAQAQRKPAAADAWLAAPVAMRLAAEPEPGVPLPLQIERMMVAKGPTGAYLAYLLVTHCVNFAQNADMQRFDIKEASHFRSLTAAEHKEMTELCSGMTERIKTSRFEHLALAAKAGVPGAAVAFLHEGPFGDPSALKTRPDDPLVVVWRQQAAQQLVAGVEAGDFASSITLMNQYTLGDKLAADPALALRFTKTTSLLFAQIQRGAGNPDLVNVFEEFVERAKAGLTAEQIAAELAAGKALVDKAAELNTR